jgi:hypothetical protein
VFLGHGFEILRWRVGPRQELVDLAVGVVVYDPRDDVGEICVRLDAAEFAGLDERSDCRPVHGAAVRAGEERVLPIQRDRANAALDDIGVDVDAAIVDEAGKALPAGERIADRLGEFALLADEIEPAAQPDLESSMIGRLLSRRTMCRSSALRSRMSLSIA